MILADHNNPDINADLLPRYLLSWTSELMDVMQGEQRSFLFES